MTTSPSSSPLSNQGWTHIFERQMDLAQWGPRRVRDHRHYPRVPWSGTVRVRAGRRMHPAIGLDLSEQGIRLEGDFEAPQGSTVSVTFDLFGQRVHAVGEVAWVGAGGCSPTYGIHFSVMRRSFRQRVSNYVASHVYADRGPGLPRPWTGGETVPHRIGSPAPSLVPRAPSYVPVRTGQTLSIDVRTGDARLGHHEHGPFLERVATL